MSVFFSLLKRTRRFAKLKGTFITFLACRERARAFSQQQPARDEALALATSKLATE